MGLLFRTNRGWRKGGSFISPDTVRMGDLYQGVIDCSTNPNYPVADKNMYWHVSAAGKIGGASGPDVEIGDRIICIKASIGGLHSVVGTDFILSQVNIDPSTVEELRTGTSVETYVTPKVLKDQGITTAAATIVALAGGTTGQLSLTTASASNGLTIAGSTSGIGVSITSVTATGISVSGVHTTGLEISGDGTTAISVTSGFTGVNMLSLEGTGSTSGISISGACTISVLVTGSANTAFDCQSGTFTTGLSLAGTLGTGVLIGGTLTTGISIGACTTGLVFTGLVTGNAIDFNAATSVTGSLIDYIGINGKTSGYLFNGSMTTSVLDASTLLDDFSVSCAHDGLAADTLRGKRMIWSGAMPNGTAAPDFNLVELQWNSLYGSGAAIGGTPRILSLYSSATINDSAADFTALDMDLSAMTLTLVGNVYGINLTTKTGFDAAIYQSGNATSGLVIAGTTTTAISVTGGYTTGISLSGDGTTAIEVTAGFSGTNMLSLAGTGSNAGVLISGACGKGIEITGSATTAIGILTGVFETGISLAGTLTTGISIGACTTGINLAGTATTGIDFTSLTITPDASRTNSCIAIGDRLGVKTITMTAGGVAKHLDPIQMSLDVIGVTPGATSTINGIYQNIAHATTDMTGELRLKCADWNLDVRKHLQDAYVYQGEIDFQTNAVTVGGEAAVIGLVANAASAVTGNVRGAIISMQGTGMFTNAVGLEIRTSCGTGFGNGLSEGIRIAGTPLPVVGIAMGNQTNDNEGPQFAFYFPSQGGLFGGDGGPARNTRSAAASTGSIAIKIGGTTKWLQYWDSET